MYMILKLGEGKCYVVTAFARFRLTLKALCTGTAALQRWDRAGGFRRNNGLIDPLIDALMHQGGD